MVRILKACGIGVLATVMFAGCSHKASQTGNDRPAACPKAEGSGSSTTVSRDCGRALFDQQMDSATDQLSRLPRTRQLALANQLCAKARQLATSDQARPLRAKVIAEVSSDWGLDAEAVEQMVDAARNLCPGDYAVIDSLPLTSGPVQLGLSVKGSGRLEVTHTGPDGRSVKETVSAPWTLPLTLTKPVNVTLEVSASNAKGLECSIVLGEKRIAASKAAGSAKSVACVASATAIERVANDTPR